jgi:hypothetical protein
MPFSRSTSVGRNWRVYSGAVVTSTGTAVATEETEDRVSRQHHGTGVGLQQPLVSLVLVIGGADAVRGSIGLRLELDVAT